jgi:hypothetical protein
LVAARFPLYETAAAHSSLERGGKIGTVVVLSEVTGDQRTEREA